jgi:hypothetical protein
MSGFYEWTEGIPLPAPPLRNIDPMKSTFWSALIPRERGWCWVVGDHFGTGTVVIFRPADLATSSGRTKVGRLVSTELIKLIDYRSDLPPVAGVGIDIVQIVSKRRKVRT